MVDAGSRCDDACAQVLGVTPQHVGTHAAKGWNMPDGLLRCMTALSQPELDRTDRRDEQHALRVATDLAVDLREIATSTPTEEHDTALSRLVKKYRKAWPDSEQGLRRIVDAAMQPFLDDAQALRLDLSRMPGQIVQRWRGLPESEPPASSNPQRALDNTFVIGSISALATAQRGSASGATKAQAVEPREFGVPESAGGIEAALQDALARMRGATAAGSVSERLAQVLGAMHRAMGFSLTVLALKDVRSHQVRPVVLEADDASAAAGLKPLFEVDLDAKDELFALLAQRKTDVFIADAQADSVRSRLPRGLAQGRGVRSFLFMSLTLDGRTLGFIYADYGSRTAPNLPAAQLALLKSMRDEAVGAFRKRVA
jgi:GAF domain-containing protein